MAVKVEDFPVGTSAGRRPKYPWKDWLDGSVWALTPGDDFQASVTVMREMCYGAAAKRGAACKTRIRDGVLYVQALPHGDED